MKLNRKKKILLSLAVIVSFLAVSMTVNAIIFNSKQEAYGYKNIQNPRYEQGDIEIVDTLELLDEYIEVKYKYDIYIVNDVTPSKEFVDTQTVTFETEVIDMDEKNNQDNIKALVLKHSIEHFNEWNDGVEQEEIYVRYDQLTGQKYSQENKEWK